MKTRGRFNLPPEWWIQTGERMQLGMGIRSLLEDAGANGDRKSQGLQRILEGVEAGQPVIAAMRQAGLVLPMETWCLLETGEQTGRLGEMLLETGQVLRQRQDTRRELVGQLWYPAMVTLIGGAVMALILLWVIPRMRNVSQSMGMGERMPWLTEYIGWIYGTVLAVGVLSFLLLAMGTVLIGRLASGSSRWGLLAEGLARRLPFAGPMLFQAREAGVLRQLGILLGGGVTLPAALEMVAGTVSNKWVQEELLQWRSRLLLGAGFREAVSACRLLGSCELPLILAGQESGQLDTYFGRIADDLYRQVSRKVTSWSRLLEPAMLLCLSLAVGGLVLAYLLPMVRMLEQAGGAF